MELFLFKNTRQVIRADMALGQAGCVHIVLPVPRHISSECGMCIQPEQAAIAHDILQQSQIDHQWYKDSHGGP